MTRLKMLPQPQTPTVVQQRDFFQTPRYATELVLPYLPETPQHIWSPFCGEGRIGRVLKEKGYNVTETDLQMGEEYNFFEMGIDSFVDLIVDNPPFSLAGKIVKKCLGIGMPFCLLLQTNNCQWKLRAIRRGCKWVVPEERIDYITPDTVARVNERFYTSYSSVDEIPNDLLKEISSSQFHSGWLTYKLDKVPDSLTVISLPVGAKFHIH